MSTLKRAAQAIDTGGGSAPGITTTLIVVALIGATTFLTWIGKVNGDAFVSLASVIIGGVLVRSGAAAASQAANAPPPVED